MARLNDKFTIEEMCELNQRLSELFYQVTNRETTKNASITELQLLNVVDQLTRISGMLCDVIEMELEGNIETSNPHGYINGKLGIVENGINNYLKVKKIELD